jgi:hypothetical protein
VWYAVVCICHVLLNPSSFNSNVMNGYLLEAAHNEGEGYMVLRLIIFLHIPAAAC